MSEAILPANPGFVFRWETPRRRRLSLLAFIAGSALLHALCFYFFQIVYPPTLALLPAPARIALISPDSPDGQVLLRWVNAEDPALGSTTQRPPDSKFFALPKIEHVASYLSAQPALKEISAPITDNDHGTPFPVGPVPRPIPPAPPQMPTMKTAIEFSSNFAELGAPVMPEMQFTSARETAPANARFRIAADQNGGIRFSFLEESSGDSALDEQARKFLALVRFEKNAPQEIADNSLRWGHATIDWGNDLAPNAPAKTP